MLYIRSSELSHLITGSLYTFFTSLNLFYFSYFIEFHPMNETVFIYITHYCRTYGLFTTCYCFNAMENILEHKSLGTY